MKETPISIINVYWLSGYKNRKNNVGGVSKH